MIKTRGHRVELDELEAVLAQHDMVLEAAAFAVDDKNSSKEIHAAVLLAKGAKVGENELLIFAKSKLPPYAIPVTIMLSDDLPRTSTGKIDRNKLSHN